MIPLPDTYTDFCEKIYEHFFGGYYSYELYNTFISTINGFVTYKTNPNYNITLNYVYKDIILIGQIAHIHTDTVFVIFHNIINNQIKALRFNNCIKHNLTPELILKHSDHILQTLLKV